MQIAQFVVGSTFALAHLFIAYTIPTSVPYVYSLADLTSALSSDVSSAASVATASASAGLGSWLKKIAFRAAGEEGLAENVRNEQGKPFGIDALHAAKDLKAREEIRYRDELQMIHCTDTSGQVFAILINCFYLLPLTWLFVRFFIRSYTKRGEQQGKGNSSKLHLIEESGKDAANDVKREVDQALDEEPGSMQGQNGTTKSSGRETRSTTSKQENSKQGTEDSKSRDDKESSSPDSGEGQDRDSKADDKADGKADDAEKDDMEILDSAEAVTDVLDAGMETADRFGKDLEKSKAG